MSLSRRSILAGAAVAVPALSVAAPALADAPVPAVLGPDEAIIPLGRGRGLSLSLLPRLPLVDQFDEATHIIMPDFFRGSHTKTRHENWWTLHHQWMIRGTSAMPWGGETVHVDSRRYREWLEEGGYFRTEREKGIPPHIGFGGAVVAGKSDPTFYDRWAQYARETFGYGWPV